MKILAFYMSTRVQGEEGHEFGIIKERPAAEEEEEGEAELRRQNLQEARVFDLAKFVKRREP